MDSVLAYDQRARPWLADVGTDMGQTPDSGTDKVKT